MNSKFRELNNGLKIPLMGIGTSRMIDPENVIYNSIKDGVRLIDTAYDYMNEEDIGKGIKKAIDNKICKREDLIIIGKIWINDRNNPEKALSETLKNLGLTYIDIYVDHYPSGKDYKENKFEMISIYKFWPKMEKLVEKKLARAIGVSNYNVQCLSNLLSFCKIKPAIIETEFHLFHMQMNLKKLCDKENIALISYYPLTYGNSAKKYINLYPEFKVFEDNMIKDLSIKYNKTPGQIILKWHYSIGVIPIPGTSKIDRMKENLQALEIDMNEEDINNLSIHFKEKGFRRFCGCKRFFGVNLFA